MLQFWKKTGQKNGNDSLGTRNSLNESHSHRYRSPKTRENDDFVQISEEILLGNPKLPRKKSSMVRTFSEVLRQKCVLHYFIQYMESRNAEAFILCWLDIETFRSDLPKNGPHCISPPMTSSLEQDDSLSVVSTTTDSDSAVSSNSSDYYFYYSEGNNDNNKVNNNRGKPVCNYDYKNCDKESGDISVSVSLSPKTRNKDIIIVDNNNKGLSNGSNVQVDVNLLTKNALVIFKKYIAQESSLNVGCKDDVRKELIEDICDSSRLLSSGHRCFEKVQNHVYKTMETEHFEQFLRSDFYCKYQIDVLTSGNVVLDDILTNETALFYFMEYLEQEDRRNLLEFWIAANNFQQQLECQGDFFDPLEAQSDAVVLYDKYFSLQAHCPLGLGDKVRLFIEQTICGENGVNLDCFKVPIEAVETVLERFFMGSFLESQLFYKFLSELINTVQSNCLSSSTLGKQRGRHKRSPSDVDSEHSFASSTFLAMEIGPNDNKKRHGNPKTNNNNNNSSNNNDMTIDTRELYDPDALWRQKRKSRLLCGHVTDLGRFETEFEPEPDRGDFNLKSVVKKLVSLDEEQKRKEEMAWQVAEMIVKDITNITLNNENN